MKLTKQFRDSVKEIVNSGKVRYSRDINAMLKSKKISQEDIDALIARMVSKDFGAVDTERARRFGNHMDIGDKDVYGVYDDIILYYDAARDQLTVVTKSEFTNYYTIDWEESDRHGFNERYDPAKRQIGKSMPEDPEKIPAWREQMLKEQRILTEGQQREAYKVAEKQLMELNNAEKPEDVRDIRNFIRYEWKVYPVEDYTKFVKNFDNVVGKDKRMNLVALAKQYNVPVKRLYAIIMYYYNVQRKPYAVGYEYIMKNLGQKRKLGMVTTDAETR